MGNETYPGTITSFAVAIWVKETFEIRLTNFSENMERITLRHSAETTGLMERLSGALGELDLCRKTVDELIARNRGAHSGVHGFIAEWAQTDVGNARSIFGEKGIKYFCLDDNGPVDLIRTSADGKAISLQLKFQGDPLRGITDHSRKYPDFVKNGGHYQIPRDQYEKLMRLSSISEEEANRLPTRDGSFSLKEWKRVRDFVESGEIPMDQIEPSDLSYSEVQVGTIHDTLEKEGASLQEAASAERKSIDARADRARAQAKAEKNLHTVGDLCNAMAVGGLLEGAGTFASCIIRNAVNGKMPSRYSDEDWKETGIETLIGTVKGAARGGLVFCLVRFASFPSPAAGALVNAAFAIGEMVVQYNKGEITSKELWENAIFAVVESALTSGGAALGGYLIRIPVLGEIAGGAVGLGTYHAIRHCLIPKIKEIIAKKISESEDSPSLGAPIPVV